MSRYVEIDGQIKIHVKIDKDLYNRFSYKIDEKLMRKYNSIKGFSNQDTGFEDGCMNEEIIEGKRT